MNITEKFSKPNAIFCKQKPPFLPTHPWSASMTSSAQQHQSAQNECRLLVWQMNSLINNYDINVWLISGRNTVYVRDMLCALAPGGRMVGVCSCCRFSSSFFCTFRLHTVLVLRHCFRCAEPGHAGSSIFLNSGTMMPFFEL